MVTDDKRIRIITGHYGSGKTEFAVNYAIQLIKCVKKAALCDLDIVNPYFRSRERAEELAAAGVEVIASSIEGNNLDIPAVSAKAAVPITDKSYDYIIDLGGNDVGVMAMGRFKPYLLREEVDFFMTVNACRPDTSTPEKVIGHMKALEAAAGLKITGIINNTNMVRETDLACLQYGSDMLEEVEHKTGVPIKYVSYIESQIKERVTGVRGELFPMKYYMREEWM